MAYFKAFIKDTPFGLSILLFALAVGFIALIAPVGGNKSLIVRSGSMQPTIAVGDLITAKPQQQNTLMCTLLSIFLCFFCKITLTYRECPLNICCISKNIQSRLVVAEARVNGNRR